uniref:N-acetylneuraminate lyase n=1 Tax=Chrysemys picta bellii TaxID=8478 RepID=A0A8C3HQP3_CHRPI
GRASAAVSEHVRPLQACSAIKRKPQRLEGAESDTRPVSLPRSRGGSAVCWPQGLTLQLHGIPKEIAGSHSSYNHSNDSRWAKHAAAIGASGIAGIAPFFFKPTNKDTLVAFLREVASEAPGIPFYYYHIPPLTGVKIRVEELLDGIKEQIPTFQGVKFSDTDLLDFAQCVKNNKEQFVLLYGVDEHLLSALAIGASGAVGSTYNYLGKKNNLMLEAFAKQDLALAQRYQFCTGEFLSFVFKLGFGVAQTKAVMTFTSGIPMGPPRLPLLSASVDFIEKAKAKMESLIV